MLEIACPKGFVALSRGCGHPQAVPINCKSPLCAECERRRAQRLQERWTATLKSLPELKLLTLTIQNGQSLAERLGVLDAAFRHLLDFRIGRNNRKKLARLVEVRINELVGQGSITEATATAWRESTTKWLRMVEKAQERRGQSFKLRKLLKGLSSLEVTYNAESKSWHAHRHLIVSTPYMPQIVLGVLWNEATEGEGQIVDVRAIYDVETGITEALKYVTKPWEIPNEDQEGVINPSRELVEALKGKKRTWVLGRIKPQEPEAKPCPGCKAKECECEKIAVVTNQAELETPNTFLAVSSKEPTASPVRLVIYRDDQLRLMWRTEALTEADLSLYRLRYQEKETERSHSPPQRVRKGGLTITIPKNLVSDQKTEVAEGGAQMALV